MLLKEATMKTAQFIKFLKEKGVKVINRNRHYGLVYKGKKTVCLRHPSKEIDNNFAKKIAKQIDLDFP